MTRRSLVPVFLLLSAAACGVSGQPVAFHDARTFQAAPGKLVTLELSSLDADVTVTPGAQIAVEVDLESRSSSPGASKGWIEGHTPTYNDSPGRLEVSVPSRRHHFLVVGYLHTEGRVRVSMPPGCALEIRTTSGDVSLAGDAELDGAVRIHTSSGDVEVNGGAGELVVNTSSGGVKVSAPRLAKLEADTSSGDIELRGGAARVIADSSSGDIRLHDLTGDLSAHSSSGDIRAIWKALSPGRQIDIKATSGEVTVRIPAAFTPVGSLSTTSGDIRSTWEGSWGRSHKVLELSASGGGESVAVQLRTTSGDIDLGTTP